MMQERSRKIMGWIAVGISTIIACFWAFWGILENFHEGCYSRSVLENLGGMAIQYMPFTVVFVLVALLSIRWPRIGGAIHAAAAGWAIWFFRGASPVVVYVSIAGPLVGLGALYWFGRPEPRKLARLILVGLPLLTTIGFGIEPAIRVAGRVDDGNHEARLVREMM
jgi:hypothetical protein